MKNLIINPRSIFALLIFCYLFIALGFSQNLREIPIHNLPHYSTGYMVWEAQPGPQVTYTLEILEKDQSNRTVNTTIHRNLTENYFLFPDYRSSSADHYETVVQAVSNGTVIAESKRISTQKIDDDGPGSGPYCVETCSFEGYDLEVVNALPPLNGFQIRCRPSDVPYYEFMTKETFDYRCANFNYSAYICSEPAYSDLYIDMGNVGNTFDYCSASGVNLVGEHVVGVRIPSPYDGAWVSTAPLISDVCQEAGGLAGLILYFNMYKPSGVAELTCYQTGCVGGGWTLTSSNGGSGDPEYDAIDSLFMGYSMCELGYAPPGWCDDGNGGLPDIVGVEVGYDDEIKVFDTPDFHDLELVDVATKVTLSKIDGNNGFTTDYDLRILDAQHRRSPHFTLDMSQQPTGLYDVKVFLKNGKWLTHKFEHTAGSNKGKDPKLAQSQGKLLCFPNPNSGHFTVNWTGEALTQPHVQVMDMMGRIVSETPMIPGEERIDLNGSGWNQGIYVVMLKDGDQLIWREKVVVKK